MAQPNLGKWKAFAAGQLFAQTGGQNLNDDLQKNLANELDGLFGDLCGPAVVGVVTGFQVSAGGGFSVNIAAGAGVIEGQRVRSSGAGTVASLPASTSGIKIYVSGGTPYSLALSAWPVSFGFTTGALTASQMLLATVTTDGSTVSGVVDGRAIVESLGQAALTIDDTTVPAASAQYLRQRFGMLARRVKDILGGTTWLDAVPMSLGSLGSAFHGTSGHTHNGTAGQGPKIAASNVTVTPGGAIESTNVAAALTEVGTDLALSTAGVLTLQNKTGGALVAGDAVALSGANDSAVAIDDTVGTLKRVLVAVEPLAVDVVGRFRLVGPVGAKCSGILTRLEYLRKSATSLALEGTGILVAGTNTVPSGAVAIALEASTGVQLASVLMLGGGGGGAPAPVRWLLQGTLVSAIAKVTQSLVERDVTFKKVWVYSDVAPTGADIILDINKNGTTIWSTPANRVKITAGANAGSQTVFNTPGAVAGDRLTLDIDQVGSGVKGGNDLLVLVEFN